MDTIHHDYNEIYEEAERITKVLIKKKRHTKEFFSLVDELMQPDFVDVRLDVLVWIPTLLARYYYDIVSFDPLKLYYYK